MLTRDDVQSFLDRMEVRGGTVEELGEGLWKVRTSEEAEVVVHLGGLQAHLDCTRETALQ